MNTQKKILAVILLLVMLAAVAAGLFWHWQHYVLVNLTFYPRNQAALDLRGEELTIEDYEQIHGKLPGTNIHWMVPFQGTRYAQETQELTVETLSMADVETIQYMTGLETVHAENCRDYETLQQLQARYPELKVNYFVPVGGEQYAPDAAEVKVSTVTDEELANLNYLPGLKKVLVDGCGDAAQLAKLRQHCHDRGIGFELSIGGKSWSEATRELTATGVSEEELGLLQFMPDLSKVHLVNPTAQPVSLETMQSNYPKLDLTWEMQYQGQSYSWDAEEVDLSTAEVTDLAQVEEMMNYFPKLQKLILGKFATPEEFRGDYETAEPGAIDNQQVADFRERARDKYKVVWTVSVGRKLTARTDDTTFRPDSHGVGRLFDDEVYNLRFCEDMICIDVGHMTFSDCSWAAYMPHLKYLILAWTQVRDVSPLGNLKELVYLELDWSLVKDVSPLVGCTALEDLNLGSTYVDATPLTQMTWLKHLWMIFCPGSSGAYKVTQAVPGCVVVTNGTATVAGGWRRLPNYYAQRDMLNMYYMN